MMAMRKSGLLFIEMWSVNIRRRRCGLWLLMTVPGGTDLECNEYYIAELEPSKVNRFCWIPPIKPSIVKNLLSANQQRWQPGEGTGCSVYVLYVLRQDHLMDSDYLPCVLAKKLGRRRPSSSVAWRYDGSTPGNKGNRKSQKKDLGWKMWPDDSSKR